MDFLTPTRPLQRNMNRSTMSVMAPVVGQQIYLKDLSGIPLW